MAVARSRSPPATLGRRPIGPRKPSGKPGTVLAQNIIPLDLTSRLQEDSTSFPRTESPDPGSAFSNSSQPGTPASAPVPLRSQPSTTNLSLRTSSRPHTPVVDGHQRSESAATSEGTHSQAGHSSDAGHDVAVNGTSIAPAVVEEVEEEETLMEAAQARATPSADSDGPVAVDGTNAEPNSAETDDASALQDQPGSPATLGTEMTEIMSPAETVPQGPPPAFFTEPEPLLFAGTPAADQSALREPPAADEPLATPIEIAAADILDMYGPVSPAIEPSEEISPPAAPSPQPISHVETAAGAAAPDTQEKAHARQEVQDQLEEVDGRQEEVEWRHRGTDNEQQELHDTQGAGSQADVLGEQINGANGGHENRRPASVKSIQASIITAERSSTPTSTRASTPALLKVIPKRPPLPPPPALNFDAEPIKWKGMTLEAAQWTFTSEQLQETVSRAIRQSAAESFIRVVSTTTYDVELPQELERLDSLKSTTQAQYRFNMYRRAMLLQSLAALSQSQGDGDGDALYNLTTQLAELTSACDRLMETLVRIADQKAQIQRVQDLHVSSALAMALRKLNASYAKRSAELKEERARNDELQAELEEAWNMAQDMAQEMDDLDNFDLDYEEGEFTPLDDDEPSNSALEAEIYSDMDRMSHISSMEVVEITGKAVASKATLVSGSGSNKPGDRTSRVIAAKKRSDRASKASLRIPKTPTNGNGERPDRTSLYSMRSIRRRRSRSKSMRRPERAEGSKQVPDVPIIRLPEPSRSREGSREGSFLDVTQTRPGSALSTTSDAPPPLPPKEGSSMVQMNIAATRSEEVLPASYEPNPPSSPTSDGLPTINLPEQEQQGQPQQHKGWPGRRFFGRRVNSMQPPLRAADDTTDPSQIKRSASDHRQFDGWPFLGASKSQRFSVPVRLAAMQSNKGRKSSDSAPVGDA